MRWARNVAHVGEIRCLCKILVGKSEGRILLKDRHRLEDNIKMNLSQIVWEHVDWIYLAHGELL
jgi:hypothetical protein